MVLAGEHLLEHLVHALARCRARCPSRSRRGCAPGASSGPPRAASRRARRGSAPRRSPARGRRAPRARSVVARTRAGSSTSLEVARVAALAVDRVGELAGRAPRARRRARVGAEHRETGSEAAGAEHGDGHRPRARVYQRASARFSSREFLDAPGARRYLPPRLFAGSARLRRARASRARRGGGAPCSPSTPASWSILVDRADRASARDARRSTCSLGPRREFAEKQEPFECGEQPDRLAAPALRGEVLHGRDPVRRLRRRGDLLLPVGRRVPRARLVRLRRDARLHRSRSSSGSPTSG